MPRKSYLVAMRHRRSAAPVDPVPEGPAPTATVEQEGQFADLSAMTVRELRDRASDLGVSYRRLRKADLVEAIAHELRRRSDG